MRKSNGKRLVVILLCVILMFSTLIVISGSVFATETRTALKFSVDLADEDFQSSQFTGYGSDVYVGFLVTPFTPVATGDGLKDNAFSDWWNGVGNNFSVEYEYYMPVPMQGVGDIAVKYSDNKGLYAASGVKDTDGNNVVDPSVSTERLQNGWYKRTVNYGAAIPSNEILHEIYFTFIMKKGDLPASGTIDLYVRSLYMVHRGTRYALYDSAATAFCPNTSPIAAQRTVTGIYNQMSEWTGIGALNTDLNYGVTCTQGTAPDAVSISVQGVPETLVVGSTYNLSSYASATGGQTVSVQSVTLNEEAVTVSDPSAFVPQAAGNYKINYTASNTENTAIKSIELLCSAATVPVILQQDVVSAVPASGYAHQSIVLGEVKASVGGQKTYSTSLEIRKGSTEGDAISATTEGSGWSFAPTAKLSTDYYVRYVAENEGETTYSEWVKISVTDIDKPVISGSNVITELTIGYNYKKSEIAGGVTVTDISDGDITVFETTLYDPLGKEIVAEDFMATMSGIYSLQVSVTDSDQNTVTKAIGISTIQNEGLIIKATVNVAEDKRAEGTNKFLRAQLLDYTTGIQPLLPAGSTLSYEVMAYTVIDGQKTFISGVGGISGQVNKGSDWKFLSDLYGDAVDSDGRKMAVDADLSEGLSQDGQSIWLKREYTLTSSDNVHGYILYHLAMEIDTDDACGETIYVAYKNIKITYSDSTSLTFWSGTQEIKDGWRHNSEYVVNIQSYSINAAIDGYPVYISGKIPSAATVLQSLSISKQLMKDALKDEILSNIVLNITDPDGITVQYETQATSYTFTPAKRGLYTFTIIGSNEEGSTTVTETMLVKDDVFPTITAKSFELTGQTGVEYIATFEISDNATANESLNFDAIVYFNNAVTTATVTQNGSEITVKLSPAAEGDYRIVIIVEDEAENESVQNFTFTVSKATSGGRCKSSQASTLTLLGLFAILLAGSKKLFH